MKQKRYTIKQLRQMGELPKQNSRISSPRQSAIHSRLKLMDKIWEQSELDRLRQQQDSTAPAHETPTKQRKSKKGWAI